MPTTTVAAHPDTEPVEFATLWQKVQETQKRASGGFLQKEEVQTALTTFNELVQLHDTCTVHMAATTAHHSHTVLEIDGDSINVRRVSHTSQGFYAEFDFLADDDRELFKDLKSRGFTAQSKRKTFSRDVGTDDPPAGTITAREIDLSDEPTEETLQSLFKINKHAREYADNAQRHYQRRKHYSAQRNSARKTALYSVKAAVLSKITDEADQIEKHKIDDRTYFCLYFDRWSFHCTLDELNIPPDQVENEHTKVLGDFEKDSDVGTLSRSLKESLLHLHDVFGVNANDHLSRRRVGDYFTGWTYLG